MRFSTAIYLESGRKEDHNANVPASAQETPLTMRALLLAAKYGLGCYHKIDVTHFAICVLVVADNTLNF